MRVSSQKKYAPVLAVFADQTWRNRAAWQGTPPSMQQPAAQYLRNC
jgi:hypothetical protein